MGRVEKEALKYFRLFISYTPLVLCMRVFVTLTQNAMTFNGACGICCGFFFSPACRIIYCGKAEKFLKFVNIFPGKKLERLVPILKCQQ